MEIEAGNIDNLKQVKDTPCGGLVKKYEDLAGISFETEDDKRRKVLDRTEVGEKFEAGLNGIIEPVDDLPESV